MVNQSNLITTPLLHMYFKMVTASVTKAELGALLVDTKRTRIICLTLTEVSYSQPPTLLNTGSTIAVETEESTIKR